jgi:hypothetical protein
VDGEGYCLEGEVGRVGMGVMEGWGVMKWMERSMITLRAIW